MLLLRGREAHRRSVMKALSWRVLGSLDTFVLGWFFTGHVGVAGAIASTEVATKMVLYYFHERGWAAVRWGIDDTPPDPAAEI